MTLPCGTGLDVLSSEEREALARLASSGARDEWGDAGRASDILKAVDEGVVPPPSSVDWFVRRFRSAGDAGEAGESPVWRQGRYYAARLDGFPYHFEVWEKIGDGSLVVDGDAIEKLIALLEELRAAGPDEEWAVRSSGTGYQERR